MYEQCYVLGYHAGMHRPPVPAMVGPPFQPQIVRPRGNSEQLVELDPEIFAAHWMSGFYEPHPSNKLLVSAIYADYMNTCKQVGRNGVLSIQAFQHILRY